MKEEDKIQKKIGTEILSAFLKATLRILLQR